MHTERWWVGRARAQSQVFPRLFGLGQSCANSWRMVCISSKHALFSEVISPCDGNYHFRLFWIGKFKSWTCQTGAKAYKKIFFMRNRRDLIWFPKIFVTETNAVIPKPYQCYHWFRHTFLVYMLEGGVGEDSYTSWKLLIIGSCADPLEAFTFCNGLFYI